MEKSTIRLNDAYPWLRRGLGWFVAGAVAVGLILLVSRMEPRFEGFTVPQLLRRASQDPAAIQILVRAGDRAVPPLTLLLSAREPWTSRVLRDAARYLPRRLRRRMPEAANRLPGQLLAIEILNQQGTNVAAATPALIQALDHPDAWVVDAAASALSRMRAASAVVPLTRLLTNRTEFLRIVGLTALGKITAKPEIAIPAIVEKLKDKEPGVKSAAAWSLWWYGPVGAGAHDALLPLLQDPDTTVRRTAYYALMKVSPTNAGTIVALAAGLKDTDPGIRITVVEALGKCGPAAKPAVPAILEAMRNDVGGLWRYGRASLLRIAPGTPEASIPLAE